MKRIFAIGCILTLSGCTSLEAVRGISNRLSSASETWNDVGGDIAGSCARESTFNPALADCDLEKKASSGLASVNTVLGAYFKALADAASDSNYTIQPGLNDAASSAANIPGINQDQVKAVSGLVGLLANLVTGALREATLRKLIQQGGPSAQTVVRSMDDLVVLKLALLWQVACWRRIERLMAMRAACWRWSGEEVEDGLPDGWHGRLRRWSPDSFFSVPLL